MLHLKVWRRRQSGLRLGIVKERERLNEKQREFKSHKRNVRKLVSDINISGFFCTNCLYKIVLQFGKWLLIFRRFEASICLPHCQMACDASFMYRGTSKEKNPPTTCRKVRKLQSFQPQWHKRITIWFYLRRGPSLNHVDNKRGREGPPKNHISK